MIVDNIWMFPKIGVGPQNGWFLMENLIEMDDLRGKPTIFGNTHLLYFQQWNAVLGANHGCVLLPSAPHEVGTF